jgi:hypothetical protein
MCDDMCNAFVEGCTEQVEARAPGSLVGFGGAGQHTAALLGELHC